MSYMQITATAYGMVALNDFLGLDHMAPEAQFSSLGMQLGQTQTFIVSGDTWDRIRPLLRRLADRRIPQTDALGVPLAGGRTMPAFVYSADPLPGARPRIDSVHPGTVSAGGAASQSLAVKGTGLVAGTKASYTFYSNPLVAATGLFGTNQLPVQAPPVAILKVVAVRKGPLGGAILLNISPALGGGSVTTVFGADGAITITVVPAAGASNSTAIAAQLNGDATASTLVVATALVASQAIPATTNATYSLGPSASGQAQSIVQLGTQGQGSNGDGMGIAFGDFLGTGGAGRLHLEAVLPGNAQNLITLTLNVSQGGNTVVVTGTDIVVNRTEATPTIANVVTALSGNATAAALVTATTAAAGNLAAIGKTYLVGGAGETPTATVGGIAATISAYTDTAATILANKTAIVGAGLVAGDDAQLQILTNFGVIAADVPIVA